MVEQVAARVLSRLAPRNSAGRGAMPKPRSMRDGNTLIGLGMATATYPANRSEAAAIARILPDGTRDGRIRHAGSRHRHLHGDDAGAPPTRSAFRPENVHFALGDSSLPKAPGSGGSQSAASVSPAVREAASQARSQVDRPGDRRSGFAARGGPSDDVTVEQRLGHQPRGSVEARSGGGHDRARSGGKPIEAMATRQARRRESRSTRSIRSARCLPKSMSMPTSARSACRALWRCMTWAACSTQKTAHSQMMGGIVWGMGVGVDQEETLTRYALWALHQCQSRRISRAGECRYRVARHHLAGKT